MNRYYRIVLLLIITGVVCFASAYKIPTDEIKGDYNQAVRGFEFLKKVRKDPNAYTERLRVSLKDIPGGPELHWNDTLASVAEQKALDMASKGYFDGVDKDGYGINYYINKAGYKLADQYLKHKRDDDFEVMIAGGWKSGEEAIGGLITDKESSSGADRKFLLAMTDFSKSLTDIGIGFIVGTKETKFRYYTVVIMAKRK